MRLLIIPFDDDLKPIESDVFELETQSKEEVLSNLKQLMKDRPYQVEVYKNINEQFMVQMGNVATMAYLYQDKKQFSEQFDKDPFETAIEMISVYLEEDGGDQILQKIKAVKSKRKAEEKLKYEQWKVNYAETQKLEKKSTKKRGIVAVLVIVVIFIFAYLVWTDELRFIGRETKTVNAEITRAKAHMRGGRALNQRVTYEFTHEGTVYKGYFWSNTSTGWQEVGDYIPVKYRTGSPTVSKIILNN